MLLVDTFLLLIKMYFTNIVLNLFVQIKSEDDASKIMFGL